MKWVDVGAMGPDGYEVFKMRVCDGCGRPVDVCVCNGGNEVIRVPEGDTPSHVKKIIDEDLEWEKNRRNDISRP